MTATATASAVPDVLGTFAKSSARLENQRDTLRRAAQRLLYDPNAGPHAQHRTVWCARTVLGEAVGLFRQAGGTGARAGGLHTCGSVWACAVCSAKVTEARRAELLAGMAAWRAMGEGRSVLLATQTFPHERDAEPLGELLDKFAKAQKTYKQSTAYKRLTRAMQRAGGVRSLEVTWGEEHGWHPHTHELIFVRADLAQLGAREETDERGRARWVGGIVDELRDAWIVACLRAGLATTRDLEHMRAHAFDLRGGDFAADYVAKFGRDVDEWAAADELTRSHAKLGLRAGRLSPFQMLRLWQLGEGPDLGHRFREFAEAFEGRRMLFWSPKLKAALGIDELSDDEIAERLGRDEELPEETRIAQLSIEQYSAVYSRGAVGELLDLVASLDPDRCPDPQTVVDEFASACLGRVPLWSKRLRYKPWRSNVLQEFAP